MDTILSVVWFFLPAAAANMAPVFFKKVHIFETPIDLGKTINGQPIFGPHKTYRGFAVGITAAILIAYIQKLLTSHVSSYDLVDYQATNFIHLGFMLGMGALLGDLVKSFIKRRINVPAGRSWVPFDQIDWVFGAMLFSVAFVDLSFGQMVTALVVFGLLHPATNLIGFWLKIKPNKF